MSTKAPYVVTIVLSLVISCVITCVRFYSRSRSERGFRWNLSDTIIITSIVLQTSLTGVGITGIYLSSLGFSLTSLKVFIASALLYYTTLWSIKFSISVSLLRMTEQLDRSAQLAKCSFCFICVSFVAIFVPNLVLGVSPQNHGQGDKTGDAIFWTTFALNIATDIMLIIIPFPALLVITERRTRICISFVFSLAGIVVIVSTVRIILITKQFGNVNLIATLSHIEVATGVIISALPEVSRTFTRKYLQGSSQRSYGEGTPAKTQRGTGITSGGTGIDFEANSATGRPYDFGEQGAMELEFHRIASTNHTNTRPV
ncbi:hypothetical protein BKA61DRAFT_706355 [Leptodontidium sp. MPI-SDFR-AT-0119]|nr:hypothetical protein BKA61DRAFT_706355 [Leptodontidium sp. MPI-SDFR-AT-0119]